MGVNDALNDPVQWVLGGITGILGVLGAVASDPTGGVAAVVNTIIMQSGTLFTGASIAGWTLFPEIPRLAPWTPYIQGAALVFAVVFVGRLLDQVYDSLKERLQ